jgi:hypothetical protein
VHAGRDLFGVLGLVSGITIRKEPPPRWSPGRRSHLCFNQPTRASIASKVSRLRRSEHRHLPVALVARPASSANRRTYQEARSPGRSYGEATSCSACETPSPQWHRLPPRPPKSLSIRAIPTLSPSTTTLINGRPTLRAVPCASVSRNLIRPQRRNSAYGGRTGSVCNCGQPAVIGALRLRDDNPPP